MHVKQIYNSGLVPTIRETRCCSSYDKTMHSQHLIQPCMDQHDNATTLPQGRAITQPSHRRQREAMAVLKRANSYVSQGRALYACIIRSYFTFVLGLHQDSGPPTSKTVWLSGVLPNQYFFGAIYTVSITERPKTMWWRLQHTNTRQSSEYSRTGI
jgi:hypothetical protein